MQTLDDYTGGWATGFHLGTQKAAQLAQAQYEQQNVALAKQKADMEHELAVRKQALAEEENRPIIAQRNADAAARQDYYDNVHTDMWTQQQANGGNDVTPEQADAISQRHEFRLPVADQVALKERRFGPQLHYQLGQQILDERSQHNRELERLRDEYNGIMSTRAKAYEDMANAKIGEFQKKASDLEADTEAFANGEVPSIEDKNGAIIYRLPRTGKVIVSHKPAAKEDWMSKLKGAVSGLQDTNAASAATTGAAPTPAPTVRRQYDATGKLRQ